MYNVLNIRRYIILVLIKQKQFKEAIGVLMSQCKITVSPETTAYLNKQTASEQTGPAGVDMFQNLNQLEFEIPDSWHNYNISLFIVCLICLDYIHEQVGWIKTNNRLIRRLASILRFYVVFLLKLKKITSNYKTI